jgi:hypothetical protein
MTALAILYHDPAGALEVAVRQALPLLSRTFDGIAICASPQANRDVLAVWTGAGALVKIEKTDEELPMYRLGAARRAAVNLALEHESDHVLYCDGDRIVHWAAHFPDELRHMASAICEYDFTVLGRTERAFNTHPAVQRDTEAIINQVFRRVTGLDWDLGSGARGLSRQAIEALNVHCLEDSIAVDVTWPLRLRALGGYRLGYLLAEGLEFETGDGYGHQQVADDDYAQWLEDLDSDPRRWAHRLKIAQLQVARIVDYA